MPWAFDVNSGRYRNAPELAKRFRILASQRSDFNDRLTFAHYISATYADRFDSYSGEQPQVTGEQSYGTEVSVQTKIVKAKGISVTLNYRIRENAGFLANLQSIPRRHHQPAGNAALGIADSDDAGRAFRLKSATCSDRSRPAVPIEVGHLFRSKSAGRSD